MKAELIIHSITLSERKSSTNVKTRMSPIRSGTSDIDGTERIISQVKNEINQNRKLLLWLNVVISIGDKRVELTQLGGGFSIRNIESFNYVLGKLREMGQKSIDKGESHRFFSNTEVSPPYP